MQEKRENTLIKFCFIIIHILLYTLLLSTQTYWITIPSIISLFLTYFFLLRIHLKTKDKTFHILLSFPLLLCYFLLWLVETYIRMLAYILIIILFLEFVTFLSIRYFLRKDSEILKNKKMLYTFTILLLSYILLYYFVPTYVMRSVDEINRKTLPTLVSLIISNSTDDTEKALRIYNWIINSNLVNVYNERLHIDGYIYFIERPPFICLRLKNKNYPLWVLTSKCGACEEFLCYLEKWLIWQI